ncbi:TPR-like protein [Pluteus cervinus]|uniref:TPR-like protein n=1 Tax=Pluteus cervinus TaxID=181527 RepID=A0ACD3B572_9AGAR|nr:TPR-like protein [Pluteus cervinus]
MAGPAFGPQPLSDAEIKAKLADLDSIPLFMKSLPEDATEDPAIAALQSLAYEGTPDEIAQNFKEQGNEYFKGKRHREALGFYTQGIDAKPTDLTILEILLCNRAACNLELENYGSVLRDCSRAIGINPKSSKAYYRSALALTSLERFAEAIDCCTRCLAFDQNNKAVEAINDKATKAKEIKDKKERAKREVIARADEEKQRLKRALRSRNIVGVPRPDGSQNPYEPRFDPESPNSLIIPVFFLYPQYATSDVIPEFVEDTTFAAHLTNMFPPQAPPPQWDTKGEYVDGKLVVFAMTRNKRLLKVGKNMSLRDVCNAAKAKEGDPVDGLELKDNCLTFAVLPKGDVEKKWVEEYKKQRDDQQR